MMTHGIEPSLLQKIAFCRRTYYEFGSNDRLNWKPMTRPAEYTRQSIIKAAVTLFSEKGFEGSSVPDIVTKARVNQAAINYHFNGKDGLYLEVLKTAFEKLTENAGFDAEKLKSLSREEALRSFVYQQLRPLLFREASQSLR